MTRPGAKDVRRICLRAKPNAKNTNRDEWETASIVVLLRAPDGPAARHRALHQIARTDWDLLEVQRTDTLVEERVAEEGGEIWRDYRRAAAGEVVMKVFSETMRLRPPKGRMLVPAALTEDLFDQIMLKARAQRITDVLRNADGNKNADYLLDDTIFELKTWRKMDSGKDLVSRS